MPSIEVAILYRAADPLEIRRPAWLYVAKQLCLPRARQNGSADAAGVISFGVAFGPLLLKWVGYSQAGSLFPPFEVWCFTTVQQRILK
jgi:hypothetical protein